MKDNNDQILAFKELQVWQKAVDFADKVLELIDLLETTRKHYRLIEQLESAVTSISLNIAEPACRQAGAKAGIQKRNLPNSCTLQEDPFTRQSHCLSSSKKEIGYLKIHYKTLKAREKK